MTDHVHLFIEAPPAYGPARVVQKMKSISAKELYKRYPELRKKMWSGAIWGEGYFVRECGRRNNIGSDKKIYKLPTERGQT
jgi:putative transposase